VGDDEEYEIEAITNERWHRTYGRQYQVKWLGWSRRTWESEDSLVDASALDEWREYHAPVTPPVPAREGGNVTGQALETHSDDATLSS
jgi:hypothetical protein